MAKVTILCFCCLCVTIVSDAQPGSIAGKVLDYNGEPIFGAVAVVLQGSMINAGITADEKGNYIIAPVNPGKYDLRITYTGYKPAIRTGITVLPGKRIIFYDTLRGDPGYKEPLPNRGTIAPLVDRSLLPHAPAGTVTIKTAEEIPRVQLLSTESRSIIGPCARESGTLYYIDGVLQNGTMKPGKRSLWQRLKFWK